MSEAIALERSDAAQGIAERVRNSGSSFYAAMRLLPKPRRDAMFAIYAFCRDVDDIADEPGSIEEKRRKLNDWRSEIGRLYRGEVVAGEIARALAKPARDFNLRQQDFLDVIDGMAMDAECDIVAPSWSDLDRYCDRVASAVGRLSVRAFGANENAAFDVAHHLGRALQLTNILRDLDEDCARGRLYLPRECLAEQGMAGLDPKATLNHPNLDRVCRKVAHEAHGHFEGARLAMRFCARRPMRPARLMAAAYLEILNRLEARGWRDRQAIKVPSWRKIWLLLRHGLI